MLAITALRVVCQVILALGATYHVTVQEVTVHHVQVVVMEDIVSWGHPVCLDVYYSYYGTDCDTGLNILNAGGDVGMLVGLSASLATASVLVIVIVVLAVCWCCRPLRRDRFELYVTPTQDMHDPTENIDAPELALPSWEGKGKGKPGNPSCSDYELGTAFKHTTCPIPRRQLNQKRDKKYVNV